MKRVWQPGDSVDLVLDFQPGRGDFLPQVKQFERFLLDPWVGVALDPEWKVTAPAKPAQVIGSASAASINAVSDYLVTLVRTHHLPQKLFVIHQFRTMMVQQPGRIRPRRHLAMVQHVDGFGTPGQKLDTFHAVAEPKQFYLGFKLFYDEDVRRMSAADVHRIRPKVRFVSFQ